MAMYAYSQDLRERVLRALERGDRPAQIARRFEVSRFWVYQVRDRFKQEGQRHSLRQGGYRVSRIAHMEDTIRGWISAEVDLTLTELSDRLATQGIAIKVPALWHQLNKWKLSFKKNPARQRARARRRSARAS
jgi:transposase